MQFKGLYRYTPLNDFDIDIIQLFGMSMGAPTIATGMFWEEVGHLGNVRKQLASASDHRYYQYRYLKDNRSTIAEYQVITWDIKGLPSDLDM